MRFPDDVPRLTDGDITLRAHSLDDAEAVVEQCTDPVSVRWTTVPLGYDAAMALDWLTTSIPDGWESGSERMFAIETTHPDGRRRFSGSLSLRDEGDRRAELAFGAHPAVRGRGVMTKAVTMLLDYGFDTCGLETVLWLANVGNVSSRRVAWKTGFTFGGGVVRRWLPQRGEFHDAWVASLHRCDPREPKSRWLDIPVIEADRFRLRPLDDRDVPRLVEASADERTRHWLSFLPDRYTEQDAHAFILGSSTAAAEGAGLHWAVADSQHDILLGTIGLPRAAGNGWELGYYMHPDARGRGIMREAVGLATRHVLLDSADGGLGATRAFIKTAAGNAASQYVAVANGYTQYGRETASERLRDGSVTDMVLFERLSTGCADTPVR
ncbi:MAG: GNAT family N-acetyltransferase [Propionibacteriales bacterium]|nr:GNAT family N-acetyltransferase [Propionibacteriales bacterium]